jgi:hypothetical protein
MPDTDMAEAHNATAKEKAVEMRAVLGNDWCRVLPEQRAKIAHAHFI